MIFKKLFIYFTFNGYIFYSWGYDLHLPPAKENYEILMLLPFCSPSHQIPYRALAYGMAQRGHKITLLTSIPSTLDHKNIKEILHGVNLAVEEISLFEIGERDPTGYVLFFKDILPQLAKDLYDVPEVMDLYNRRDKFDVIITDDLFNESGYPFLVGRKYVVLAPFGIRPQTSALLGNVLNPSFNPSITTDYTRPYSFVQRVKILLAHILPAVLWNYVYIVPAVESELKKKFPTMPPLEEIEKGISLVLANVHFSLDIATPLLPSQIEVGGIHCRPGEQLPNDLQTFIDGSGSHGTIYFSFGSLINIRTMPENYRNIIIQVFRKLKQRIIWKIEEEIVDDLPDNVLVKNWLPQQDILAHPNVKLFISHGGLLSLQESIYHATPILSLPIVADQMRNRQRSQNMGFGKYLLWDQLSEGLLISTINDMINNNTYKDAVEKISATHQDQQLSPLDNAIWWIEYFIRNKGAPHLHSPAAYLSWIEYFIRNKGAPHLHSPAAYLSWIEYLMIDVLILIQFILFCLIWIFRKLLSLVLRRFISADRNLNKNKVD